MNEYMYEIKCDFCNTLLGFWRWAGPFHGSMCCAECKSNKDDVEVKP